MRAGRERKGSLFTCYLLLNEYIEREGERQRGREEERKRGREEERKREREEERKEEREGLSG